MIASPLVGRMPLRAPVIAVSADKSNPPAEGCQIGSPIFFFTCTLVRLHRLLQAASCAEQLRH